MGPRYPPEAERYRAEARAFLAEHLPATWRGLGALAPEERAAFVARWRAVLADRGLLALTWDEAHGGAGLSLVERAVLAEELARAGVPHGTTNDGFSINLLGNAILHWGTEAQKAHFLPRILSGEDVWCQGYSEPNAGSDLASIGTRAVLDGDEWVINGQKTWTSQGHNANWVFVLCRTDPDAPKHRGISFLLCPIDQPGVEVRPLVNAAGHHDFNEVFFTDARTPADHVVGAVGDGWRVANTVLRYERGGDASVAGIRYREEWDRLVAAARARGRTGEPVLRQRLARAYAEVEIMRYLGMRTMTSALRDEEPGPGSSLDKLNWSEYHQRLTELAVDVLGAEALAPSGRNAPSGIGTDDVGAPDSSRAWVTNFIGARPGTIYSGSSEVQRNIIAERVLGLPREPQVDKDVPWRELRR